MSSFSAMRFVLAFLLMSVLRIAQVRTLDATIKMVAASTIQPPHAMRGTKSRMSTRNARSEASSVGIVNMRRARRKRADDAGAWKCADTASIAHISVSNAAIGWMIRM